MSKYHNSFLKCVEEYKFLKQKSGGSVSIDHFTDLTSSLVLDFDCTITYRNFYFFINNPEYFIQLYMKTPMKNQINNINNSICIFDEQNMLISLNEIKVINQELFTNNNMAYLNRFIDLVFGGQQRLNDLKGFLENLKNNNINIFVSSRGRLTQILNCLKIIDLYKYFTGVHAIQECIKYFDIVNQKYDNDLEKYSTKDKFILDLFNKYHKIIYIDDNHMEHKVLTSYMILNMFGKCNTSNYVSCNYSNKNKHYYFIDSLVDTYGGGINKTHIEQVYAIIKLNKF